MAVCSTLPLLMVDAHPPHEPACCRYLSVFPYTFGGEGMPCSYRTLPRRPVICCGWLSDCHAPPRSTCIYSHFCAGHQPVWCAGGCFLLAGAMYVWATQGYLTCYRGIMCGATVPAQMRYQLQAATLGALFPCCRHPHPTEAGGLGQPQLVGCAGHSPAFCMRLVHWQSICVFGLWAVQAEG